MVRASSPGLSRTRLTIVLGGHPSVGATTVAYHTAARLAAGKCSVALVCRPADLERVGMERAEAFSLAALPAAEDPLSAHARAGRDGIAIFVADDEPWERFGGHLIRLNGWFDHVIVDVGSGGAWAAQMPWFADALILVAVPGGRSLSGLYGELAQRRQKSGTLPKTFLIVNRAQTLVEGVRAGRGLSDAARTNLSLHVPAVGCILEDPVVARIIQERIAPAGEEGSPAGRRLIQVARNLEQHSAFEGTPAGFLNLWRRFGSES